MAEYQIFSDGACDIGFAKAKELGIPIISEEEFDAMIL